MVHASILGVGIASSRHRLAWEVLVPRRQGLELVLVPGQVLALSVLIVAFLEAAGGVAGGGFALEAFRGRGFFWLRHRPVLQFGGHIDHSCLPFKETLDRCVVLLLSLPQNHTA